MKVFYSPQQSVAYNESFSPSAGKPARLIKQWLKRYPLVELVAPQPVTLEQLCLAHDPDYVQGVLECQLENGFGNQSPEVAASLPWTTGSLVSALEFVHQNGGAACSPTSGFHHAHYSYPRGFCTFNGLMVAAILLGPKVGRLGILDCDFHYGDGTDDIIEHLGLDFVAHYTTGGHACHGDPDRFLKELPEILNAMKADLLIYQAGADAHLWDPLGGWMTSIQMRMRDRLVFRWCHRNGVPVVWNLAGGYQEDFQSVLDLHHATLEECMDAFRGGC